MCLPILLVLFLFLYPYNVISQPYDYPTAILSTSWTNSVSANHSIQFGNVSIIRAILLRSPGSFYGPSYTCGFYCNGDCKTYLFAIFIVYTNSGGGITNLGFPQVVWSANRNNTVQINSTLELTAAGDLVLKDADGTVAWSTGTAGMSVAGLNLTDLGNLVLFDTNEAVVWQSFNHPTDALVPGQRLVSGQKLTSSISETNWTQGVVSLSMTDNGLVGSVGSDPLQVYYSNLSTTAKINQETSFTMLRNGSLGLYINSNDTNSPDISIVVPQATSAQYIKLQPDGRLVIFEWNTTTWAVVADISKNDIRDDCKYPNVCGKYGICSGTGQCNCPGSTSGPTFFNEIDPKHANLGCSEVVPMTTCDVTRNYTFLDMIDTTYFNFNAEISGVNVSSCKDACLRNCSCVAAIFMNGFCHLPSQVFSLINNDKNKNLYNSSVSLKVQMAPSAASNPATQVPSPTAQKNNRSNLGPILGSTIGILCLAIFLGIAMFFYRKKHTNGEEAEEDYLDLVPGMPTRFAYEELVTATDNSSKKLGQGGFGSVFHGYLKDGMQIAVKCLDEVGHIRKSFLAEVESIGSIHHINLVRLVGFCAEKSHRLLVYEYMCNGSLDKWIYSSTSQEKTNILDWRSMRKMILDIAKGLAYLHEDCRQKIIHLDIKPQNILLDENFNAKLADFGLSKLIDRDQSEVVTTMRGTPGYLAPEWLSAGITEKVDVYSFGIVVLEIVCGRRNFEQFQPEEERHLLNLFKKKAMEGRWLEIVNKTVVEMQSDSTEAVEMMQIAAWCLQTDYTKRPSMSTVVKVLEGLTDVDKDLDFNFLIPYYLVQRVQEIGSDDGTRPFLTSDLSGPG